MILNSNSSNKIISTKEIFYINENISKNEKIQAEQRRRNHVYKSLDYLLTVITYFDFFSAAAFKITKNSKDITKLYKTSSVTSDFLLLSFIYSNTEISNLLEIYGINKEQIFKLINNFPDFLKKKNISNYSFIEKIKYFFKKEEKILENHFSHEVNLIFEKAAENALIRFKTPIISSEILFLTLIEQKNNKTIKLLKKLIGNDLNWQLLRYQIIKRIHREESSIREEITKNQYYFAYLLKMQLTDIEFDHLIKNDLLGIVVPLFRNTLISQLLQNNINNIINRDIYKSIKITNQRIYLN
jgi:hypothetical protein